MKTLVRVNPMADYRAMDEMFSRFFGRSPMTSPNATNLPIDVFERDGKLVVKAAIPGIDPENIDIQIENNVLTIRGDIQSEYESDDVKVYRREMTYGSFARSIRLPENLAVDAADAEFSHGFVTISFQRLEEEKPKSIQVRVRQAENKGANQKMIQAGKGESPK